MYILQKRKLKSFTYILASIHACICTLRIFVLHKNTQMFSGMHRFALSAIKNSHQ